ncbi:hypothetical protein N7495_009713 [Penicillium taxi]|uniref:uncharacterized protein n=1 Tax=Penicillium taxi TaxID=168475 RepID=UPI00254583E0|nr:uncharacterized protein N7495_009713 [Penicillium taxi]KAJ5885203.1 hypothetical protein N7495_009713 [Penicillium taxi]
MSSSIQSPSSASQYGDPLSINTDSLRGFLSQLNALTSSPESQTASNMLQEIDHQRERVHSQDEELMKAQKEILNLKERKRVTIEEMFAANESVKAKEKEALDCLESLRVSVIQKDKTLNDYSKQIQGLRQQIDSLKSSYALEHDKVSQSVKEISTLQQSLKEKEKTIDNINIAGLSLKSMLSLTQKKKEELEAEKVSLNKELQSSQGRLQKIESFAVQQLKLDEISISTSFSDLWVFASSEISTALRDNIDEKVLKDKPIWDKLQKENSQFVQQYIPLVPSNSPQAKGIRVAMTLAILSREICKQIFRPNYILPEDSEIHRIISHLAENDSEKESFCRRFLLSIDRNAEERILHSKIQMVIRNVSSHLWTLLSDNQYEILRISLGKIVRKAAEVWNPIQRAQQRYETEFDLVDFGDDDWELFHFPGDNEIPDRQNTTARDVNILTVFPCISLVKDGVRDPLTKIIQLRSTQKLFIAAEYEASQISKSSRRSSTRSRRRTITDDNRPNRASFLEEISPGS